jgi:hypothetical protein
MILYTKYTKNTQKYAKIYERYTKNIQKIHKKNIQKNIQKYRFKKKFEIQNK